MRWIISLNSFKHAFLYYRGSKVKHYEFPTSLAARVPDMTGPGSQMHSLESFAQNRITWGERHHMSTHFCQRKAQQRWCSSGPGNHSVSLIQQEASWSGRWFLDCSKSSSVFGSPLFRCRSYEVQPRFCFVSLPKESVSYMHLLNNPIVFHS